jgi:hypothetical protein
MIRSLISSPAIPAILSNSILVIDPPMGRGSAWDPRPFRLGAHVRNRIAPIAESGRSANGTHLENIGGSRDEARNPHSPRGGKQTAGLPWTLSVAGAYPGRAHFIALSAGNGGDFQHQLRVVAEIDAED